MMFSFRLILSLTLATLIFTITTGQCPGDTKIYKLLPGLGWDNLQNREMAPVASYTYDLCRTIQDGRFLVPDDVLVAPIETNQFVATAELIESYTSITSSTATTINEKDGLDLKDNDYVPSGSFSEEVKTIKEHFLGQEANVVTIRAQIRKHRYIARLKHSIVLTKEFKQRLMSIAVKIKENRIILAAKEGHKLVNAFGTHILTSVVAGNGLKKMYSLDEADLSPNKTEDLVNNVHDSFFKAFQNGDLESDNFLMEHHNESILETFLTTSSGQRVDPATNVDAWKSKIDSDELLEGLDRSGEPLYNLIVPAMLPELHSDIVSTVKEVVQKVIETYYEMNTIKGCCDPTSHNFNPSANVDDGSCHVKPVNFTFGGFFQSCQIKGSPQPWHTRQRHVCKSRTFANPKTGVRSCPPGFMQVPLFSRFSRYRKMYKHCDDHTTRVGCNVHFSAFTVRAVWSWCSAFTSIPNNRGYLFGGFYFDNGSSRVVNPLTGSTTCPDLYKAHRFVNGMRLCLTEDFGQMWMTRHFGGFFSCEIGNQLAMPEATQLVTPLGSTRYKRQVNKSKKGFEWYEDEKKWPKKCPMGYNQYPMTAVKGTCVVYVCIKPLSFKPDKMSNNRYEIRRPPFANLPYRRLNKDGYRDERHINITGALTGLGIGGGLFIAFIAMAVAGMCLRNYIGSLGQTANNTRKNAAKPQTIWITSKDLLDK